MGQRLTDKLVTGLPAPKLGNKVYYDAPNAKGNDWTSGFGLRVTVGGGRAFVLNYRTKTGRERRLTIGSPPAWNITAARLEAKTLRRRIDLGEDPLGDIKAGRDAPTVADLCDRFIEDELAKKRLPTQRDYKALIANEIRPALGGHKVAEVTYADVDRLHRRVSLRAPYLANRTVALLSRLFSLSIRWQYRADNPAKGIERNAEQKRKRYATPDELERLTKALAEYDDTLVANVFRLLLLTGARKGEILAARWPQFDLENGVWTKPGATTKQKTDHVVPLNEPAIQLVHEMHREATAEARKERRELSEYVFPGPGKKGHLVEVKKAWAIICKAAKINGLRIHDLRHSYASVLASSGHTLPIIGALLGHTQAQTTMRYSHLFDDPLRAATNRAGAILTGVAAKRPKKRKLTVVR
jgi:integrase